MKQVRLLIGMSIIVSLVTGCNKSTDPSLGNTVSLKMSALSANGSTTTEERLASLGIVARVADSMATASVSDVTVNVQNVKFDFDRDDEHIRRDSTFDEDDDVRLKGPFIVDLMKDSAFINQVIISVNIPNAKIEKVRFKLAPSKVAGDMDGKSIVIKGMIGTKPFVFWDKKPFSFSANLPDSTSLCTCAAVTMTIHLELDKIMAIANRQFLLQAKDGNGDGTITIDRQNDDGNEEIAEKLIWLIEQHHHIRWEREKENH
jgi:hypothetical protein